jgi:hypothetical protein
MQMSSLYLIRRRHCNLSISYLLERVKEQGEEIGDREGKGERGPERMKRG